MFDRFPSALFEKANCSAMSTATTWRGACELKRLGDVAQVQSALNIAVEPQISYVLGALGMPLRSFEIL